MTDDPKLAMPSARERAATRALSERIVESVRADEVMPLPDSHPRSRSFGRDYVESLVMRLAMEVVARDAELAAMAEARNEACELLEAWIGGYGEDSDKERLFELRKIGTP